MTEKVSILLLDFIYNNSLAYIMVMMRGGGWLNSVHFYSSKHHALTTLVQIVIFEMKTNF